MAKTVSLHVGGGQAYRAHNGRHYKPGHGPDNVDEARRGANETLVDIDHQRAYEQIFGQAVNAYNDKQKRAERKIADYFSQVEQDKTRHPVYEVIIQVGDRETTGVEDCDTERAILREYIEGFEARNPQMVLVGAYIHADESTLHAHVDFVPWADGYSRGPARQCSISRCCEQMGHEKGPHMKETAQAAWTASERQTLEAITQAHGIEVAHIRDGRLHEADKEVFAAEQEARRARADIQELRGQRNGLMLEVSRQRMEARGQGIEQMPFSEAIELRNAASELQEVKSELKDTQDFMAEVNNVLQSNPELWKSFQAAYQAHETEQAADEEAEAAHEPEHQEAQEDEWADDMELG